MILYGYYYYYYIKKATQMPTEVLTLIFQYYYLFNKREYERNLGMHSLRSTTNVAMEKKRGKNLFDIKKRKILVSAPNVFDLVALRRRF